MRSIQLQTEIPGPRSRALMARRQAAIPSGIGHSAPVFVDRASGALLHDVDGNTFIDFAGGIGTLNVGHSHPAVARAAVPRHHLILHVRSDNAAALAAARTDERSESVS